MSTGKKCPWSLMHVLDHNVRLQEMWCKYYLHVVSPEPWGYDGKLIEWRNGYKRRKVQKPQTKEELMSIAWHPSRLWKWCIPKDDKK